MQNNRLVGLDLVRGLCALAVMVYHYTHAAGWGDLEGMGTYGVYIFFVLSGFALFYRYGDRSISEEMLRDFFRRRFFRIFPLFFAVAIFRSFTLDLTPYNVIRLIVHATPLAGIADVPAFASLVIGGWSILIEWSFYLLFPVLLLFRQTKALIFLFLFTLAVNYFYVMAAYYPPDGLSPGRSFRAQDTMTFLCYFVGGMLGAKLFKRYQQPIQGRLLPVPLVISIGLMASIYLLPEIIDFGSRRDFLSGWNSTALVLASCILVLLASLQEPMGFAANISKFLGDISFALYLLHMYVWNWVGATMTDLPLHLQFAVSVGLSLPLSWLVYSQFETRMNRYGKTRAPAFSSPFPPTP